MLLNTLHLTNVLLESTGKNAHIHVFAFCNHAGGSLIMSYTTCEMVDDTRHINYDVEVRRPCIHCGEQYTNKRPIGGY